MKKYISFLLLILGGGSISAQEYDEYIEAKRRIVIEDFLETYEAAYEKKRIKYIENFFSDKSLIITETRKHKPNGSKETVASTTKRRQYETLVEDRKEYITRLRKVFKSNTSIMLSMGNVRIDHHPKYNEIYGVSFSQLWKDQNGGDNLENQMPGFIFLMIDFRDSEQTPIIHVRTWQPKDNIKHELDLYSLSDFRIIRTR